MDSGVIQCHAWDQAGLQWMFAHAVNPDFPVTTECKPPQCGEKPGGQFWSCTPAYELQVEQRLVALPMLPHSSAPNACSCVSCHTPPSTNTLTSSTSASLNLAQRHSSIQRSGTDRLTSHRFHNGDRCGCHRYGYNRVVQCGGANNDTGPIGVLMNRDSSTQLHCWSCFGKDVCAAMETQHSSVSF